MPGTRHPILFTGLNRLMALLGLRPSRCWVDAGDDVVQVRFAWAFRADIPRAAITAVAPYDGVILGWGVHGWGGRWLVNGSMRNLVEVTIDPPAPARVVGWPVKLRTLWVSAVDRPALIGALAPR